MSRANRALPPVLPLAILAALLPLLAGGCAATQAPVPRPKYRAPGPLPDPMPLAERISQVRDSDTGVGGWTVVPDPAQTKRGEPSLTVFLFAGMADVGFQMLGNELRFAQCDVMRFVADGEATEPRKPQHFASVGQGFLAEAVVIQVPLVTLRDLAGAEKVTYEVCALKGTLRPEDQELLRLLVSKVDLK